MQGFDPVSCPASTSLTFPLLPNSPSMAAATAGWNMRTARDPSETLPHRLVEIPVRNVTPSLLSDVERHSDLHPITEQAAGQFPIIQNNHGRESSANVKNLCDPSQRRTRFVHDGPLGDDGTVLVGFRLPLTIRDSKGSVGEGKEFLSLT